MGADGGALGDVAEEVDDAAANDVADGVVVVVCVVAASGDVVVRGESVHLEEEAAEVAVVYEVEAHHVEISSYPLPCRYSSSIY